MKNVLFHFFLLILVLSNVYQSVFKYHKNIFDKINTPLLIFSIILIISIFKKRVALKKYGKFFKEKFSIVPQKLRYIMYTIAIVQFFCLMIGETYYPFADVGMFKWATRAHSNDKIYSKAFYYFKKDDEVKIINLRSEHTPFGNNLLGWRYNQDYTFSASYHNRGKKENFYFLKEALLDNHKINETDTIRIGVLTVDFFTKNVFFEAFNDRAFKTERNIAKYYDELYIPEYLK